MKKFRILLALLFCSVIASSQTLLFNGNMETGTLQGYKPEGNDSSSLGTTISTAYVRSGTYSMKTYLHRINSPIEYRTMVYLGATDDQAWNTNGIYYLDWWKPYWMGISVYIPSDWVVDDVEANELIWQLHGEPDAGEDYTNPPLALYITGDEYSLTYRWSNDVPTVQYTWDGVGNIILPGAVSSDKGKWVDWLFHFRCAWDNGYGGFVAVYKNGVRLDSVFTPVGERNSIAPYITLGVYKWGWKDEDYPPSGYTPATDNTTYYFDEINLGDSLNTPSSMTPTGGGSESAGNYYISPSGSDATGTGTYANPWRTWLKGCSSISSGDTLRAAPGDYPNDMIWQPPSGTSSGSTCLMVTGTGTAGDTACIRGLSYGLYMRGKQWVSINGNTGIKLRSTTKAGMKVIGYPGSYPARIDIRNVNSIVSQYSGVDYEINNFCADTTACNGSGLSGKYLRLQNVSWSHINQDREVEGDCEVYVHDIAVISNWDTVLVKGGDSKWFTHYWTIKNVSHMIIDSMTLHDAHSGIGIRGASTTSRVFFQNSRLFHVPTDTAGKTYYCESQSKNIQPRRAGSGYQMSGMNDCVIRFNKVYNDTVTWTSALDYYAGLSCIDGQWADNIKDNVIYNNSFYGVYDQGVPSDGDFDSAWAMIGEDLESTESSYAILERNDYYNNIIAFTRHGPYTGVNNLISLTNYSRSGPTDFTHRFNGNCLWDDGSIDPIKYVYSGGGTSGSQTLAYAKSNWPTQWQSANIWSNPTFSDTTIQGLYRNFALNASSPCIDAGVPLDTVKYSVSNNSTVYLKRSAAPFCPGWGLVPQDSVSINGEVYGVNEADVVGDWLVLSRNATSIPANTPVWFYKNGAIVNDIGAQQYVAGGGTKYIPRRDFRGMRRD